MQAVRRFLRLLATALLVAIITATAFFAGYGAGTRVSAYPVAPAEGEGQGPGVSETTVTPAVAAGEGETNPYFHIFWEAWRALQEEYYGELPDDREMTYGAIRGVLQLLDDRHTVFLDPEQARLWSADIHGSFEGIGAVVDEAPDGGVLIVETFEGQPAQKAGLRHGDVILAVDGQDVTRMSLAEAISLIRGPNGTSVRLLIKRSGEAEPFEVEVMRARIDIPVIKSEMLEGDVAYLRLLEFNAQSPGKVKVALQALLALHPRGLIFDLRGNPGGLLDAAVDIASFFVPQGDIVIERFKDGREHRYPAKGKPLIGDVPLVVLVNGASASASEIVAGAIQDNDSGLVVGEQTFGKGSVQTQRTLSDGSMLRITSARWFTPRGRAIHGQGLTPDVIVELKPEDEEAGRDPQLERAMELLLSGEYERLMEDQELGRFAPNGP